LHVKIFLVYFGVSNQLNASHPMAQVIIYKGYVIIRKRADGWHDAFRAESTNQERVAFSCDYESMIDWIDFLWDGKEPEGYFNRF
jgi:hypothetical protein